jgi:hypothetical protein
MVCRNEFLRQQTEMDGPLGILVLILIVRGEIGIEISNKIR